MTSTTIEKKTTLSRSKQQNPKYNVILHNDDVNDVIYVMECLMIVVNLSEQKSKDVMLTAHMTGKALVITCELEHAEHYKEQLVCKKLNATIEEA